MLIKQFVDYVTKIAWKSLHRGFSMRCKFKIIDDKLKSFISKKFSFVLTYLVVYLVSEEISKQNRL